MSRCGNCDTEIGEHTSPHGTPLCERCYQKTQEPTVEELMFVLGELNSHVLKDGRIIDFINDVFGYASSYMVDYELRDIPHIATLLRDGGYRRYIKWVAEREGLELMPSVKKAMGEEDD